MRGVAESLAAGAEHLTEKGKIERLCHGIVLSISLIAGGASAASQGGLRASRAEMTPPRRMTMRHGRGTRCARSVFRAKRKRERVSAKPIGRHEEAAEERDRGAEPLGGGAVRTRKRAGRGCMQPFIRAEHGLPCGNGYCRKCRSKAIRPAQRCQHDSMTVPTEKMFSRRKGMFQSTIVPSAD